jgi:L-iditol 2-dehydrogenase
VGGWVFLGGYPPGTTVSVDTRRAHYEELTLLGAFHHTPDLIRRAVELLEANIIEPEPLVTHRMGLGGVREALDLMATGNAIKVLIEP